MRAERGKGNARGLFVKSPLDPAKTFDIGKEAVASKPSPLGEGTAVWRGMRCPFAKHKRVVEDADPYRIAKNPLKP